MRRPAYTRPMETVTDDGTTHELATGEPVDETENFVEEELLVEEISIDGMCGVY